MPLLKGDALQEVVRSFRARGTFFYHACQLQDFGTYVTLGGIPSRNLMETSRLPYTRFDTDAKDHQNAVWPKVFGNLSDFGHGFSMGQWSEGNAPTPNPYGPILLVANPEILLNAEDVAICLRSAGGNEFSREAESLSSSPEVDRIFLHPADSPDHAKRTYIKYSNQLRKEFGSRYAATDNAPSTYNPEISCTTRDERLPLSYLSHIVVDRFYKGNQSLLARVAAIAFPGGLRVEIRERRYLDGRRNILEDLSHFLHDGVVNAAQLSTREDAFPQTRDWATRIAHEGLEWQFLRYARYLWEGTITKWCEH